MTVYAVVDNRLQAITVERVGDHTTPSGEYRVLVRGKHCMSGRRSSYPTPQGDHRLHVQPIG
jgi:hypothetical protein